MDEPLVIVLLFAAFFSVVVTVGWAQLEMSNGTGPMKSFSWAVSPLLEVRLLPSTLPKVSHALPPLPVRSSAVRLSPASPNSNLVRSTGPSGRIVSVTVPELTAASYGGVGSGCHVVPSHSWTSIVETPLWKLY